MPAAYGLLRCIGKSAVKHIVNLFTYGVGGDILVNAWDYWQKATREEKRAAEVQAVAQLAGAELRAEVERIVREEAAALPPAQQAQVAAYLGQVPASIRRSLHRPSDPTGTTTAPGTVFRRPEDLLPLLPAALPRFKAGDRPLPGVDWELVELLGIGGFGEVWKARNPHFDGVAPVALKFCLDAAARERLLKHEAAVLNQVMRQGKHEGIVPLLHTYLSADPPCLAYEFIEGGDLAGLIQERATGLAPRQAAQVMKLVAEIVAFAHRLNPPIVHRDLKPANILVKTRPDGELAFRVTDFGIGGLALQHAVAQSRSGTNNGEFLTAAVRGAYTPLYASPQQMRGDGPDPRDDVYALGVIWHQLLTGDLTKGRPGGEAWRKRLADLGMTPALLALLASSYEDERADRPASALVLAERLDVLLHEPTPAAAQLTLREVIPVIKPVPVDTPTLLRPAKRPRAPDGKHQKRAVEKLLMGLAAVVVVALILPALGQIAYSLKRNTAVQPRTARVQPPPTGLQPPPIAVQPWREAIYTNSIGMKFARIRSGTFWMGGGGGKPGARQVTIAHDFYLGVYTVTQEQWRNLMGYNPSYFSRPPIGATPHTAVQSDGERKVEGIAYADLNQFPVDNVPWEMAQKFIQKLNAQEGRNGWVYRLPTEAEWEYACRGGATSKEECAFDFYLDRPTNDLSSSQANFDGSPKGVYLQRTTKVGSYAPNRLGLYDMHGNVWQWCEDSEGSGRVLRGGSWNNDAASCGAAYRNRDAPSFRNFNLGFRLARVPSGG